MKNTIKSLLAVAAFAVAMASCNSKPAETTVSEEPATETAAPVISDSTAVPADTTAQQ
jgi:predicted small lipoprotein YifL